MVPKNPLSLGGDDQFAVGTSDFAAFDNGGCRCDNGAFLFCRNGRVELSINQRTHSIIPYTSVVILPGFVIQFSQRSADFAADHFTFSRELFTEAGFRLSPIFFQELANRPVNHLPERMVAGVDIWFKMVASTYLDRENIFRNTIIRNRLQNMFLEAFDKLRRSELRHRLTTEHTMRQTELFHRFMALVHEKCGRHREVQFYADTLCVSTRYLSTIIRQVAGTTAKELIDQAVILDIKLLLRSTDLSVQEIAYRMHFPDQSYMGRFFKKHTRMSPTEYRVLKE